MPTSDKLELSPEGQQRLAMLFTLLDTSLERRLLLAKDLHAFKEELFTALRDMAKGLYCEKKETFKDGSTRKRVYQRGPNMKAIEFLLQYSNYEPRHNTTAILELARAESSIAQKYLIASQKALADANTDQTRRITQAQDRGQISETLVEDVIIHLSSALINVLQAIDPDDLGGEDKKQGILEQVMKGIAMAKKELLAKTDAAALPAQFEPKPYESEDEEEDEDE